jgi:hypothetical protein
MKALREGVLSETMDIEKAVAWLQKATAKAPVARRKYFILSFADVFVLQERLVREDIIFYDDIGLVFAFA